MKNEHAWMKEGFSFLQWVVFLLANALSLPVVIGQLYHLSAAEVAGLMQRTFCNRIDFFFAGMAGAPLSFGRRSGGNLARHVHGDGNHGRGR